MLRGSPSEIARHRAFTLVELLVVIGVIGVLVAILLPALASARRQSRRIACLAALHEIGTAFSLYTAGNQGYWPMNIHQWTDQANAVHTKRWYDFISSYLNNDHSLNLDGDGAAPTIVSLMGTNNPLWGCPTWDGIVRGGSGWGLNLILTPQPPVDNGYALNLYPLAPQPDSPDNSIADNGANTVVRVLAGGLPENGWYFKTVKWTHPAERALVYDSIESQGTVSTNWPWWIVPGSMPSFPDAYNFSPDFNRHGKAPGANGANDRTLNMLFCDGHGAPVSAREAFTAIRMMPAGQ